MPVPAKGPQVAKPAEYAIYYHDHCANGFTAAWAAATILGPDNCDCTPPATTPATGLILTRCRNRKPSSWTSPYPRPIMKRLIAEQPYLRLFDHHQTALQNLAGLPGCVLDMERSGAMITWQTLTQ